MAAGIRKRVFCASMADVFEARSDLDAQRARLWTLISETPGLDWLLLTKRPQNIKLMLPKGLDRSNIWLGTTAENQENADERIPHLLRNRAAKLFVSYEPALGPIVWYDTWTNAPRFCADCAGQDDGCAHGGTGHYLDWLIVGGESGPHARPFDLAWGRSTIAQCKAAGVPVFFKQAGALPIDSERYIGTFAPEDKRSIAAAQALGCEDNPPNLVLLHHYKGGDLSELPLEFNVREFPNQEALR
jgi:hypothetical protein